MNDQITVHLVYPADEQKKSSPWSVGNNLAKALRVYFKVEVHDWEAKNLIIPGNRDILIGHPHPKRNTVFRRSFGGTWAHRYVICPFTTNPQQMFFVEPYVRKSDAFFAICGPVWAESMHRSMYAHLSDKFVHLNMAIDSDDWPPLEKTFGSPQNRKVAYIGSSLALKGTPFLEHLAARRPSNEIGWIGASSWVKSNADCISFLDLNSESGRKALASFDFVISPGRSDANPTVLLEAMSLGLIPICTRESGYDDPVHFYSMKYGDIPEAQILMDNLQNLSDEKLLKRRDQNFSHVKTFTWERFTRTVTERILRDLDTGPSVRVIDPDLKAKTMQLLRSSNSPYRGWRNSGVVKIIENRFYLRYAQIAKFVSR